MADKKTEDHGVQHNPHVSEDDAIDNQYEDLDPTKVVGTYAMQPDPNADRPAPLPVITEGMKKAPADDKPGTPAPGTPGAKHVEG